MPTENGQQEWSMINVRNGYLVTEGCAHCGARLSFFSLEDAPPKDSYAEGKHIWKYRGSSQTIKFDLKHEKTGGIVKLDSVVGIMLCTVCNPDCPVGARCSLTGKEKTWIYIALCADTTHAHGKCVSEPEARALEEYFNQGIKTPGKKVVFVPCRQVPALDTCQAEIIADSGLTEIY